MNYPAAKIATNIQGDPEVGSGIVTGRRTRTRKRRVLIGWNHQDDSSDGLLGGKLWCWRTEHDKLAIYDTTYNRSKIAGDIRFCGVANFTMVRMFHPYWCDGARVPDNMNSDDKRRCRYKYSQLIRRWQILHGHEVDTEPWNPIQPDDPYGTIRRAQPARRGRGGRSGRGGRRGRGPRPRNDSKPAATGEEQSVHDSERDDRINITDESMDSDGDADNPSGQPQRSAARAFREAGVGSLLHHLEDQDDEVNEGDAIAGNTPSQAAANQGPISSTPPLEENGQASEHADAAEPESSNMFFPDNVFEGSTSKIEIDLTNDSTDDEENDLEMVSASRKVEEDEVKWHPFTFEARDTEVIMIDDDD